MASADETNGNTVSKIMSKILVIGGNRFFGKRLVHQLIDHGDQVTVLNRGNRSDDFGDQVDRITCDRKDRQALQKIMQHKSWDLIYDQMCFDAFEAKDACDIFSGSCGKYIFTSTQSVYGPGANLKESDFNPIGYRGPIGTQDYGEAKRQAEAEFFSQKMPVAAVRFPVVMGPDDYTERLKYYVDQIKNKKPIYFPDVNARMSFIHAQDAANGLFMLGKSNFTGPVNMASKLPIKLLDLVATIESCVKEKAIFTQTEDKSPYGIPSDWFMNVELAIANGFTPKDISEWLPQLIRSYL